MKGKQMAKYNIEIDGEYPSNLELPQEIAWAISERFTAEGYGDVYVGVTLEEDI